MIPVSGQCKLVGDNGSATNGASIKAKFKIDAKFIWYEVDYLEVWSPSKGKVYNYAFPNRDGSRELKGNNRAVTDSGGIIPYHAIVKPNLGSGWEYTDGSSGGYYKYYDFEDFMDTFSNLSTGTVAVNASDLNGTTQDEAFKKAFAAAAGNLLSGIWYQENGPYTQFSAKSDSLSFTYPEWESGNSGTVQILNGKGGVKFETSIVGSTQEFTLSLMNFAEEWFENNTFNSLTYILNLAKLIAASLIYMYLGQIIFLKRDIMENEED